MIRRPRTESAQAGTQAPPGHRLPRCSASVKHCRLGVHRRLADTAVQPCRSVVAHRSWCSEAEPRVSAFPGGAWDRGRGVSRATAILLLALLAGTASASLRSKQLVQEVGLDQHLDAQLPLDVMVRDEAGRTVRLEEYFGEKPVVLNFVYFRCPMLCTQVLNGLLRSSQAMELTVGEDYQIVSISIDPRDTAEMARAKKSNYVAQYRRAGADRGWHFLTADAASIERLTRAVGFRYRYDEASNQYAHASGIVLLTPQGRVSRYFYGIDYEPGALRLGLVESSQNRIGTLADQVLLLCYHYDPATGKYGLAIANLLRVAGLATLLCLGLYLFRMYRLERSRVPWNATRDRPCGFLPLTDAGPRPSTNPIIEGGDESPHAKGVP